jgi:hypothetical protein
MGIFIKNDVNITETNTYTFAKETELQELLYNSPEIILGIPELELEGEEIAIKFREYSTSRGPIDLLFITKNANIILVETKLMKNPESIRTVAAQIIDYIKALTVDGCENIQNKKIPCMEVSNEFSYDDKFLHLLHRNFSTGNICAVIIGDDIHPNLLGLVDSIQSAPHLAFHISLVRIETYEYNDKLLIMARVVENTKEVERSVIKITFENNANKPIIESETPSKDGKGSKPKLSWEEYINNVDTKYQKLIEKYKQEWIKHFGETVNMGTVGFTAGVIIGEKRLAPLWVYDNKIELITEKGRKKMGVSDNTYLIYNDELKKTPEIYDKYLISGKQMVHFNDVSIEALENIFIATLKYADEMSNEYKKMK